MVEPIEAQNNIQLPIVVEPVEAKSIPDLPTVAKSNTDLPIGVEHIMQFQLLIYARRG